MKRTERAEQARRVLDTRFRIRTVDALRDRPKGGWIRAIRTALGMTQADLARSLHLTQAAIANLEQAERRDGITIAKLRDVAGALDCDLIYALVPKATLDETVRRQALIVAHGHTTYVDATMALEDQALTPEQQDGMRRRLIDQAIASGDMWR